MMADSRSTGSDLRRLFLRAAREILDEPDTSLDLRKVAERAGKSRTAPYLVFGKKEEGGGLAALRTAVAAEGFRELAEKMEVALASTPDPEEGLHRLAAAYLAFAHGNPRLFRLMFEPAADGAEGVRARSNSKGERARVDPGQARAGPHAGRKPRPEELELANARRSGALVIREAVEAQSAGYLRNDRTFDSRTVSGAVWAMLHGVAMLTVDEQWSVPGVEYGDEPEELAQRVLEFLTTASSRAMRDAGDALDEARRKKAQNAGAWDARPSTAPVPPPEEMPRPMVSEPAPPFFANFSSNLPDRLEEPQSPTESAQPAERAKEPESANPPQAAKAARPATFARPAHPHSLNRARNVIGVLQGARILWIDDHPQLSDAERRVLEHLGASVVAARETWEAIDRLRQAPFDVVVSDIARQDEPEAGVLALPALRHAAPETPVVFYVSRLPRDTPPPAGAFGITNDPDELLHLILDVLERKRL